MFTRAPKSLSSALAWFLGCNQGIYYLRGEGLVLFEINPLLPQRSTQSADQETATRLLDISKARRLSLDGLGPPRMQEEVSVGRL